MIGHGRRPQLAPLPHGVVAVLQAERWQRDRLAQTERAIRGRQLAHEDPVGPGVADDVMLADEQGVTIRAEREQRRPQERPARQVERLGHERRGPFRQRQVEVRAAPQVVRAEGERHVVQHLLARLSVDLDEARPQNLVALDQLRERPLEPSRVDLAVHLEGGGDDVGGAALRVVKVLEQPESLLAVRQRVVPLVGRLRDRGAGWRGAPRDEARQRGEARRLEQIANAELEIVRARGRRRQSRRLQAVAAEAEEIVVEPDAIHAEHARPQPRQRLLHLRSRRPIRRACRHLEAADRRERLAIELAADGPRQRGHTDVPRRDHVFGQHLAEAALDLGDLRQLAAVRGNQIRVEPAARVVDHHADRRLCDRVEGGQRGFDFAQLDAEAAQLDLVVDAAEELDRAVRVGSAPDRRCGRAARRAPARTDPARSAPRSARAD